MFQYEIKDIGSDIVTIQTSLSFIVIRYRRSSKVAFDIDSIYDNSQFRSKLVLNFNAFLYEI